jgi:hypothetical protein
MSSMRWPAVLALVATVLGCSSSGGDAPSSDAGRDAARSLDARIDRRSTREASSADGGRRDARPADAAPEAATASDSNVRDAQAGDARAGDAAPRDASIRDARSSDSTIGDAKDARPGDSTLGDARASDASSRDAPSSDTSPRDARTGDARSLEGGARDGGAVDGAESGADAPSSTMISTSPLALQPSFSTTIHDYYLECAKGTNTVTVSLTAAQGSTIGLLQPTTTPPSAASTTTLDVTGNDAIVVGVTGDGGTDAYWVRCLPPGFPTLEMTPHPEAGTPTPGYYLVGNTNMARGDTGYAIVLDGNGVPVWYHTTQTGHGAIDVDNLIPGVISYLPAFVNNYTFGSVSGEFELHDLDAGTTSYVEPDGIPLNPHELQALPNGDFIMFSSPVVTGVDLSGLGGSFTSSEDMANCVIQEVDPTGAEVWEWTATDHFDPVQDSTWPQTDKLNGVVIVDVFHCNSIDIAPSGDLLVSARSMDSVFMISKATGAVLWKMGGSTYTKEGAPYITVTNDPEVSFYRQHDARLQPNGDISMFDDQTDKPGPARAVIYSYDVDAGTAMPAWQYVQGTGTIDAMGSFRISADGSRVVGWGATSRRTFTEVDEDGDDLLDFKFADGSQSYRAIKIPTSAFDLDLLRATAGQN